ncbi:chemotaxis response regulator protein-glutamate methylesterase [Candidatus Bathyarchaeota archaeon]|nr:chemotaxis response regulator protein-glutamate methylesterase [Candidatus Bathyarchaeota archaeon]
MQKTIRVLVVDDSFFIRTLVSDMLNSYPDIQVVGIAKDGYEALEKVKFLTPDVVTLDFLMLGLTGLDTLKCIMKEQPTPVVMLSAYTGEGAAITIDCLEAGAVGFVPKPSIAVSYDIEKAKDTLVEEIRKASKVNVQKVKSLFARKRVRQFMATCAVSKEVVVVVGASTGGPPVLERIMSELPSNFPAAILIVQHMPAKFTRSLAERLDKMTEITVKEAEEGDIVESGRAYIAPGDFHMTVMKKMVGGKARVVISLNQDPLVHCLRPSIDVTMKSVADVYGESAVGVILTGMGEDGAQGMKAIKRKNGRTITQDEATSLIFGMPKRVIEEGAADYVLPFFEISQGMIQLLQECE